MRLSALATIILAFVCAAAASLLAASYSVTLIEDSSEIGVREALDDAGMSWAEVQADGLKVTLAGTAPTEAIRFSALSTVGSVVDAARIIDDMQVQAIAALAPPRFSAEILRNNAGLSIIGLIPEELDREDLLERFAEIGRDAPVADLIETARFPAPDGLKDAMDFAIVAMERLPRAKVSIEAHSVAITAITDSPEEKADLERYLNRTAPPGLRLALSISAPRPVITPFTLRFVKDDAGTRFDACSADSDATERKIIEAARAVGLPANTSCKIGLGVPSPNWGTAVEQAINALDEIGQGTVTFSDADITLMAAEGTAQATFDRVIGELENGLPEVFALHARLPETVTPDTGPTEFVATLSPEGLVQLRGRLSDENLRHVATSYAQAAFGSSNVYTAARVVEDLPADWPLRVLAGLESLAQLSNGSVTVSPESVNIRGNTGDKDANARIATLLAEQLGEAKNFQIEVVYQEKLDPIAGLPTPEECEAEIAQITENSKITFEPSSATIDVSALGTLDDIADVLKQCGALRLEIQGHTDSQGREIMNLELSQARATSVLNELRARRVLTSTFSAKGYGETQPIAENNSEEGREANRRIEFRLIRPKPSIPEGESSLESLAQPSDIDAESEITNESGEDTSGE
ncbi:MAG: OmpA family protein [Paracoccaceae bacterium]